MFPHQQDPSLSASSSLINMTRILSGVAQFIPSSRSDLPSALIMLGKVCPVVLHDLLLVVGPPRFLPAPPGSKKKKDNKQDIYVR